MYGSNERIKRNNIIFLNLVDGMYISNVRSSIDKTGLYYEVAAIKMKVAKPFEKA